MNLLAKGPLRGTAAFGLAMTGLKTTANTVAAEKACFQDKNLGVATEREGIHRESRFQWKVTEGDPGRKMAAAIFVAGR
jgi:hypothetical protein